MEIDGPNSPNPTQPAPTLNDSTLSSTSTSSQTKNDKNLTQVNKKIKKGKQNKKTNKFFNYIPTPGVPKPTKIINIYNNFSKKFEAKTVSATNLTKNTSKPENNTKKSCVHKSIQTPKRGATNKTFKSTAFQSYFQPLALPEISRNFDDFNLGLDTLFKNFQIILNNYVMMDPGDQDLAKASIKKMFGDKYFTSKENFLRNLLDPSTFEFTIWTKFLQHKGEFHSVKDMVENTTTGLFIIGYFP